MSQWQTVCHVSDLVDNSGVCALVDNAQIAIFSVATAEENKLYAIHNWDPIGKANVLYRGLLGNQKEKVFVASPLYKQKFCLQSGECLDDENIRIPVFPVRLDQEQVQVNTGQNEC